VYTCTCTHPPRAPTPLARRDPAHRRDRLCHSCTREGHIRAHPHTQHSESQCTMSASCPPSTRQSIEESAPLPLLVALREIAVVGGGSRLHHDVCGLNTCVHMGGGRGRSTHTHKHTHRTHLRRFHAVDRRSLHRVEPLTPASNLIGTSGCYNVRTQCSKQHTARTHAQHMYLCGLVDTLVRDRLRTPPTSVAPTAQAHTCLGSRCHTRRRRRTARRRRRDRPDRLVLPLSLLHFLNG
jgi:hypothetical protein